MRFREDKPGDLERTRAVVAEWREQNPAGTADQLTAALGSQFHSDYGPVLRGMLFAFDRDHAANTRTGQAVSTSNVFTGSATVPPGALTELAALRAALPGYEVTITSRSRTHRFEAVRRHNGPGPLVPHQQRPRRPMGTAGPPDRRSSPPTAQDRTPASRA
jgi:hypothetical protein